MSSATLDVTLRVVLPSAAAPPHGSFDSPADGAVVSGEVAVTGWAVDDIGLAGVEVYRNARQRREPARLHRRRDVRALGAARRRSRVSRAARETSRRAGATCC